MQFIPLQYNHLDFMGSARPNWCEDTRGITAVDSNGQAAAICVMDSWSYNSCILHIWIKNPMVLRRGFAEEVFKFVFSEESGRTKVLGITPADNQQALKFNKHIGFREIFRIPDGFKQGIDFVVQELNKSECRYIEHGQERRTSSARLHRRSRRRRRG